MKSDMKDFDFGLLETVNPVFNTAKMTLFQLGESGDEDAKKLIEKMGLSYDETQNSKDTKLPKELLYNNILILETRYRTMMNLARSSGFSTEIDLPCGYSPRALQITKDNINFIGMDLPAAIMEAEPAICSLATDDIKDKITFAGVDATNYTSIREALKNVSSPICITTEGLLMYFNDSEAEALCKNVRRLLEEFGGCWITPDPECGLQYVSVAKAVLGDRVMELLTKSRDVVSSKSDVSIGNNFMNVNMADFENRLKYAIGKLTSLGFKVERIPIFDYLPELRTFSKFSPEQVQSIKEAYKKVCYWKLTLSDQKFIESEPQKAENLEYSSFLNNDELTVTLKGRLDTLSAPGLLTFVEGRENENKISKIVFDFSSLDYISSAGIRVILMLKKKYDNNFSLINVNEECREIFEQTGFSDYFGL